jgi:ectoine hydroxylase-related dioxygenase (phytanoyl-CoA dioxygenase family)
MITVFVYLSEHTEENGAVYALQWSHKWWTIEQMDVESHPQVELHWDTSEKWDTAAELSIQYTEDAREEYYKKYKKIYLTGNPGDVVFSHPWLLHWSHDNLTTKNRDLSAVVYASTDNLPKNHSRASYLNEKDYSPIE